MMIIFDYGKKENICWFVGMLRVDGSGP